MKSNVHPTWYSDSAITCSCGNTFQTGSSLKAIKTDICHKCHPFYTGEMKFVDVQGRVEKFQAKQEAAKNFQKQNQSKSKTKQKKQDQATRSLKEVLSEYKDTVAKQK